MKKIFILFIGLFFITAETIAQCNAPVLNLSYTSTTHVDVSITNSYGLGVSFQYRYSIDGTPISTIYSFNSTENFLISSAIGVHEVEVTAICGSTTSTTTIESIEIATVIDITCFDYTADNPQTYLDGLSEICKYSNFSLVNNTDLETSYNGPCFCEVFFGFSNDPEFIEDFSTKGIFWSKLIDNGCLTENEDYKMPNPSKESKNSIAQTGRKISFDDQDIESIRIYDIQGRAIQVLNKEDLNDQHFYINDEIGNGIFFIHLINKEFKIVSTNKVFIE